jgi:hypothetical protein
MLVAYTLDFLGPGSIVVGFAGIVGLPLLVRGLTRLGWPQTVQLLFPRLAAGVAIGYLFLVSAPHLVQVAAGETASAAAAAAGLLVAATFGYTVFHVSRRVHPGLRPWPLARRSTPLVALGGAYALLGLALFSPLFGLEEFHGAAASVPDLDLLQRLLLAAVALGLGMVLELAWEEKPLTEPL